MLFYMQDYFKERLKNYFQIMYNNYKFSWASFFYITMYAPLKLTLQMSKHIRTVMNLNWFQEVVF
jgi:hypothetical protein